MTLKWFRADLHVHTCLSPCGELVMSPCRIVAEAGRKELDVLAITDHNSAENVAAVQRAAEGTCVRVLPGLEVCSSEEVHVLALFDSVESALQMQDAVYRGITAVNDPDAFGLQVIANERDEVEGFQQRLLIGSTGMSVDEVVGTIHDLDGLAIASHVDRENFGIIGHLGFIPRDLHFDALEISTAVGGAATLRLAREYPMYEFIRSSDAHAPGQIGQGTTRFLLEEPTCRELRKAFRRLEGRGIADG